MSFTLREAEGLLLRVHEFRARTDPKYAKKRPGARGGFLRRGFPVEFAPGEYGFEVRQYELVVFSPSERAKWVNTEEVDENNERVYPRESLTEHRYTDETRPEGYEEDFKDEEQLFEQKRGEGRLYEFWLGDGDQLPSKEDRGGGRGR